MENPSLQKSNRNKIWEILFSLFTHPNDKTIGSDDNPSEIELTFNYVWNWVTQN